MSSVMAKSMAKWRVDTASAIQEQDAQELTQDSLLTTRELNQIVCEIKSIAVSTSNVESADIPPFM